MTRRAAIGLCTGVSMAVFLCACGQGERAAGEKEGAKVLARVGSQEITQADLDEAIASFPKHEQTQYQSVMGRKRLLDQLVDRLLLVQAAEDQGLDENPEVASRLRELRRSILTAAYHNYLVEQLPKPTEEDLKAYYDAHHEEFVVLPRVQASWIKCATKPQAEAARRRIVVSGEHFGTVAREVTADNCSKKDNGLLGYFNPDGYVRCIGKRPEFTQRVFHLEAEDVSEIFEWDGGFAFVKVHERTTERQEPFSKARERITARLRPQLTDSMLTAEVQRLRQRSRVDTYLDTTVELADKSAEELMRLATESSSPLDKVEYYRALLEKYPHHERADEAQFMIGFVASEEMQDYEMARREYQKVVDHYPDSDIRKDALYMLQNLGNQDLPAFQDTPTSDEPGR